MKLWALAGLVAGAALMTLLIRHRGQKAVRPPSESDNRYSIDELITAPGS